LNYTGATTVSTIFLYEYENQLMAEAKYAVDGDYDDLFCAIQTWNDTAWESFDANTDLPVYALENVNGKLYAGGAFSEISSTSASYISGWYEAKRYQPFSAQTSISNSQNGYTLYPNPAHHILNIKSNDPNLLVNCKMTLTDIYGREVFIQNPVSDKIFLSDEKLKAGVYIYKITDNTNGTIIQKGKLIFN
jgi:hypothetical protein